MTPTQLSRRILELHAVRYPKWEIQDAVKLLYQSEYGPAGLPETEDPVEALAGELSQARAEAYAPPYFVEAIGEGLCRLHLDPRRLKEADMALLDRFREDTGLPRGDSRRLWQKLGLLSGLAWSRSGPRAADQVDFFLTRWAEEGCPPLHHSEPYRAAYRPHYRVVARELAAWGPALRAIDAALRVGDGPVLVAIDGRTASGRTSFAQGVARLFPCNVFHMEDYTLPEETLTPEQQDQPGGYLNLQRVEEELLFPLSQGKETGELPFRRLNLLEGSYALHPRLALYSQVRILVTCSQEVQLARLAQREDRESLERYCDHLLPLEENHLERLKADRLWDAIIDTSRLPAPAVRHP